MANEEENQKENVRLRDTDRTRTGHGQDAIGQTETRDELGQLKGNYTQLPRLQGMWSSSMRVALLKTTRNSSGTRSLPVCDLAYKAGWFNVPNLAVSRPLPARIAHTKGVSRLRGREGSPRLTMLVQDGQGKVPGEKH